MHIYSYLALGDSYTIGEAVPLLSSFPYQTVQLLRNAGYDFMPPEIIAKSGWTTDELEEAMKSYHFLPKYDFVSLLIGVNNQYRGRDLIQYKEQFEELMKKAITLANGKKEHVVVISIPDYSRTPYAEQMNREKIAREIEVFNSVNRAISTQYKVQYLDISTGVEALQGDTEQVTDDKLHPSVNVYAQWAEKLFEFMAEQLK